MDNKSNIIKIGRCIIMIVYFLPIIDIIIRLCMDNAYVLVSKFTITAFYVIMSIIIFIKMINEKE